MVLKWKLLSDSHSTTTRRGNMYTYCQQRVKKQQERSNPRQRCQPQTTRPLLPDLTVNRSDKRPISKKLQENGSAARTKRASWQRALVVAVGAHTDSQPQVDGPNEFAARARNWSRTGPPQVTPACWRSASTGPRSPPHLRVCTHTLAIVTIGFCLLTGVRDR
jgi:hypothetical protein